MKIIIIKCKICKLELKKPEGKTSPMCCGEVMEEVK